MRPSSALALALLAGAALAEPPGRVVSINICTDQLAVGLAAPGQLISVTRMGQEQSPAPLAEALAALPGNSGRAEDVYLMRPDLVLAGTFTAPATLAMLERLGIPVETFPPANALADIPLQIRRMGALLGQSARAEAEASAFEARLAALAAPAGPRPRIALTYVNSFVPGEATLEGDILKAAGFDNVAREVGLESIGVLPLEDLVLLAPDVIVTGTSYAGHARAQETLAHPALAALGTAFLAGQVTTAAWTCGTSQVLGAVEDMVRLRARVLTR